MKKIAVIGVGQMGSAIVKGLTNLRQYEIIGENHVNPRVSKLAKELNFDLVNDLDSLIAKKPEMIILTTPVNVTLDIAKQLQKIDKETIIISAAAAITAKQLQAALPNNPVARIIPNTPVAVNAGTIATYLPDELSAQDKDAVTELLNGLGDVITVNEKDLSIVGTIGGCGPAFVDVFLDALGDSGVLNGISRDLANKVAASMVKGAATLAYDSELAPSLLRDQVCSPGGTTIKGVASLEKNNFRNAVIEAVNEANQN